MSESTGPALQRKQPPRRATSQLFRRPSLDQVQFGQPLPKSLLHIRDGTSRPVQALSGQHHPSALFQIPESNADSERSQGAVSGPFMYGKENKEPSEKASPPGSPKLQVLIQPSIDAVPARKSSLSRANRPVEVCNGNDLHNVKVPPPHMPPPKGSGATVPHRGGAISPVRATSEHASPQPVDGRHTPLKTYQRTAIPMDIVEMPELRESGFSMALKLASPVFTGGGSVEGNVSIVAEGGKPKSRSTLFLGPAMIPTLSIDGLTVDVLGLESCRGRKHVFRSLAMELIDESHPPPPSMLASSNSSGGPDWMIAPSTTNIPFCVSLPVNMGPSPYRSKIAKIQYFVSVSASIKIGSKLCCVRTSREIDVLTVQDPNTTLVNMRNPLVASDSLQYTRYKSSYELRLIAGVHRQTWVSGSPLYADIYISNKTNKPIKRMDISLEKAVLFYGHSAATINVQVAEQLRMPEKTQKEVVARRVTKADSRLARHGWMGTSPQSQDESTCTLDVPTGLVTVNSGRFFSVRYFLTIAVSIPGKKVSVQIPLIIIHPNSLDIIPNALAQVSRAIENARREYSSPKQPVTELGRKLSISKPIPEDKSSGADLEINQPIPYNMARRKSIDRAGFDGRYREAPTLRPRPSISKTPKEYLRKVTFEPLQLNLPEPPKNGSIFGVTSPLVPLRSKAHTPSKSSSELGIRTTDIRALTKELNNSPRFKARKSEENSTKIETNDSIMMRRRPRASSDVGYSSVREADLSHISLNPIVSWVRDGDDLQRSDGNISGWDGFRSNHTCDLKLNERNWSNTYENRDVSNHSSPNQEIDWEDVDSQATDGLGGGPGPDVGRGTYNCHRLAGPPHRRSRPLSGSTVRLKNGHRVSRPSSNSSHHTLSRALASPKMSYSKTISPHRRGSGINSAEPFQLSVQKYHIRRTTGNSRSNYTRTQNRNLGSNPFFHGSSRLANSNTYARMRAASVTAPQNSTSGGQYDTGTFSGRDRSASESVRWENRRALIAGYGRDGAQETISRQHQPRKDSEVSGMVTDKKQQPLPPEGPRRDGRDIIRIPRRKASAILRTPPTLSERLPKQKDRPYCAQDTTNSNSSSGSSTKPVQNPPATGYAAQVQEWRRIRNGIYGLRVAEPHVLTSPSLKLVRKPSPDLVRKLSWQNDNANTFAQRSSPDSPEQLPRSEITQTSPIARPGLGTYSSTKVPTLNVPPSTQKPPSRGGNLPHMPLPFTSVSTSPLSSPPSQMSRPSSTDSHDSTTVTHRHAQASNDRQELSGLSNMSGPYPGNWRPPAQFQPQSRPPPTHPNSNVLSPIAESVGGRTPASRRVYAEIGSNGGDNAQRKLSGPLMPYLRHFGSTVPVEKRFEYDLQTGSDYRHTRNENGEFGEASLAPPPLDVSRGHAIQSQAPSQTRYPPIDDTPKPIGHPLPRGPPSPFLQSPDVPKAIKISRTSSNDATYGRQSAENLRMPSEEQKRIGRVEAGRVEGRRPGERRASQEARGNDTGAPGLAGAIERLNGADEAYDGARRSGAVEVYGEDSVDDRRKRDEKTKRRRREWLQGLGFEDEV